MIWFWEWWYQIESDIRLSQLGSFAEALSTELNENLRADIGFHLKLKGGPSLQALRYFVIFSFLPSLLMKMRYFLILCLSQFSSWQFRVQFRSVGGWYKFCERLGARSGRGRSKLFFGWFVARCTFPAIWRFEVEVQIWGLGDSGINI